MCCVYYVLWTMCCVLCTMCCVLCAVCYVLCAMYFVLCTMYYMLCAAYYVLCTMLLCAMWTSLIYLRAECPPLFFRLCRRLRLLPYAMCMLSSVYAHATLTLGRTTGRGRNEALVGRPNSFAISGSRYAAAAAAAESQHLSLSHRNFRSLSHGHRVDGSRESTQCDRGYAREKDRVESRETLTRNAASALADDNVREQSARVRRCVYGVYG